MKYQNSTIQLNIYNKISIKFNLIKALQFTYLNENLFLVFHPQEDKREDSQLHFSFSALDLIWFSSEFPMRCNY